jgi:putative acetyltransferase
VRASVVEAIDISVESPDQPGVVRLIEAGDALSASLYPAESNHMLALDALLDPAVTFLVARRGNAVLGCAALVRKPGYAELKRMFVDEAARGQGIARMLLERIEAIARAEGIAALKLETGIHQPAALALYRSAGFADVPPFGEYRPDPLSVFMAKPLA